MKEKLDISKSSKKKEFILKCPKCFNIPKISEDYNGYYRYKCRNNHEERLELIELLDKCSTSEIYKCSYGNETNSKDKYLLFNFCLKCKKIICSSKRCLKAHRNECDQELDKFVPCKDLNTICYEHGEKIYFYCPKCEINICEKCKGHEEHEIILMNKMNIEEKDIKLYDYKIRFTKNYLDYIEREIKNFILDWKEDFKRNLDYFEETVKEFLDKNRTQIKLIQNILNTYKIKGNISIENYKNIKTFCNIPEFKFNLPYGIKEKKEYIEEFSYKYLINEEEKKKCKRKNCEKKSGSISLETIKGANKEIIKNSLIELIQLFGINKIEKEEKLNKAIEYVLNGYLSKNNIYNDNNIWYKKVIKNNVWDIINYLPNV